MPVSQKIVIECPECGYTKVITRNDALPDVSMFQKCPKCGSLMVESQKHVDEAEGVSDVVLGWFGK